mmetsp:Transcript_675/g.1087  ORF Transcript_675/g.1087 Transcript_675/m.1087 type:complete len:177 (-) Transcript_675:1168-1698(-)
MSNRNLKKNPMHYIEHLEYKNRQRKIREQSVVQNKQQTISREQNFNLFWNGANDIRIREQKKREEQSKSPAIRKRWGPRRKWNPPMVKNEPPSTPSLNGEALSCDNVTVSGFNPDKSRFRNSGPLSFIGTNVARPGSSQVSETGEIARRIQNLSTPKKKKILEMLEQLEKTQVEDN